MARQQPGDTVVRFYQLQQGPMEKPLVGLLGRIYGKDLKVCLVAASPQHAAHLDEFLWIHSVDSFLPHGPCTGLNASMHPIIICTEPKDINGASILVLAHGLFVETFADYDMILDFVSDQTPEGMQITRERYRRYREAGCRMEYWVQTRESGWQLKSKEPKEQTIQAPST